jgi:hypothetical protein
MCGVDGAASDVDGSGGGRKLFRDRAETGQQYFGAGAVDAPVLWPARTFCSNFVRRLASPNSVAAHNAGNGRYLSDK